MPRMLTIRAVDANHQEGGHARLMVSGLTGAPPDLTFTIQRFDIPEQYLARNGGGWQIAESQLQALGSQWDGRILTLDVGPDIVDHLQLGQSVEFRLVAADAAGPMVWPEVAPSILHTRSSRSLAAGRRAPAPEPPRQQPDDARKPPEPARPARPEPIPEPIPGPIPGPVPAPDPVPPPRRRWLVLAALGLLVLLLAGGGVTSYVCPGFWPYCLAPRPAPVAAKPAAVKSVAAQPPAPGPATAPPAAPKPATAQSQPDKPLPCVAESMFAQTGSAEQLFHAADRCQGEGAWGAVVAGYQRAAELGYGPAATALAHLYDPVGFRAGQVFDKPDPYQAAKYYAEAAAKGDPQATAPREALHRWLLDRKSHGDTMAQVAIEDFWPKH